MLNCFICKEASNNTETFFEHLKKKHKLKNIERFQCTFRNCHSIFENFSSFKKHVINCVKKRPIEEIDPVSDEDVDDEVYIYSVDSDVLDFQKEINDAALELACSLCANMKTPRGEIYETIALVKEVYVNKMLSGVRKIFVPRIRPEEEENVYHFTKAIESSFDNIKSECKLNHALTDLDLIAPVEKCEIYESADKVQERSKKKKKKQPATSKIILEVDGRKRTHELVDSDGNDEADEDIVEEESGNEKIIKGIVTLMPIEFQIRKFFELPNVYEKIKLNTAKIQEEKDLNHFIKGTCWQKKLKNFPPDAIVIPFHFYGDGLQVNNPLGPHSKPGQEQLNYFSFPTVPYEFQPQLENIFVAQAYPGINKISYIYITPQLLHKRFCENDIVAFSKTLKKIIDSNLKYLDFKFLKKNQNLVEKNFGMTGFLLYCKYLSK